MKKIDIDVAEAWLKENDPDFPFFGDGGRKRNTEYPYLTNRKLDKVSKKECSEFKEEIN